jgi:hypothetical protein
LTYLLDNNVISYFLLCGREGELAAAAGHCELAMADATHRELLEPHTHRGHYERAFASSPIRVIPVLALSDAEATQDALSLNKSRRGRGERASIALAVHDPSLIFIANDKNAMWNAIAELHGAPRVLGVPPFLRILRERASLSTDAIDDVIGRWNGRRPTWWADWRSAQT